MAFLEKLVWAFWFGSSEITVNYRFLERTLPEKKIISSRKRYDIGYGFKSSERSNSVANYTMNT